MVGNEVNKSDKFSLFIGVENTASASQIAAAVKS
jgi:hypothetical protein